MIIIDIAKNEMKVMNGMTAEEQKEYWEDLYGSVDYYDHDYTDFHNSKDKGVDIK